MEELQEVPIWSIVLLAILLLLQSTLLFLDARKRTRYYWIWGLWGLTQLPFPSLIYIVFFRFQLWHKLFGKSKNENV